MKYTQRNRYSLDAYLERHPVLRDDLYVLGERFAQLVLIIPFVLVFVGGPYLALKWLMG